MKLVVAAIADSPFKYLFSHSSHMDHETCDRRFLRKSGMSITASWGELRLTDLGQLVDKLQRQRRKLFQWQRLTGDLHMEHRSTNLKISPLEKRSSKIGTQREDDSLPFTGERPCRRSGHPAAPSTAPPVGDLSTGVAKPCVPRGAAGQTSSGRPSCRRTAT
jgi:hypothetical protein